MLAPSIKVMLSVFSIFFLVGVLPQIATAIGVGQTNVTLFVAWAIALIFMSNFLGPT